MRSLGVPGWLGGVGHYLSYQGLAGGDELAVVGEILDSAELIRVALNGFSKSWETFVRGIVARENMPSWERLWDDFVQEEL